MSYTNPFHREGEIDKRWHGIERDLRILFTVLPNYVRPHSMNFCTSLLGSPREWLWKVKSRDHKTISSNMEGNYHELLWLLESALYRKRYVKILKYILISLGGVFPQTGALLWVWRNYPSEIMIPCKKSPVRNDEKWFFTNGVTLLKLILIA